MATIPAVLVLVATPFIFLAGCFGGMFCMNMSSSMLTNGGDGCCDHGRGLLGQSPFLPTARVGHYHDHVCGGRHF